MTFALGDEVEALRDTVFRFAQDKIAPRAAEIDETNEFPRDLWPEMGKLGLLGITADEDHGGAAMGYLAHCVAMEEISRASASVALSYGAHSNLCVNQINRNGTPDQKARYLPKLITGEHLGALAMSEPGAGSDVVGMKLRAERRNDRYILNGNKMWITNCIEGNFLAVLAKTDPETEPKHKGMSLILVEKDAGYKTSKLHKLGYKGIDTGEVVFDNTRVPLTNLIGPDEGRGLQQILGGLELGRINVAARGVGVARAALNDAVAYALDRKTFGKPIAEHQSIQIKLADMATRVEAARLLVDSAARAYDKGQRCDMEAGMAKLFATEAALENAIEAMRIHGAYGYSKEYNVERYFRDAPLLCIGEGTNELQRIIIARQLTERAQG
ncbi:MAG TPA: acyl-CoA dehydrogenase [Rhodospirillaceae bacterium]|nr:acyl-CoA dehydrogenase [Rhodospirillaceae bacterium]